jgi:hypothetical protein
VIRLSISRMETSRQTALLSAVFALMLFAAFQPAALAQGGYDTTDFAPPEEVVDQGPKPAPQEYEQQGDEQFVPGTSKYYQPKAVNDLEKWFSQYDEIRKKYENTPDERQYFESLASKPPGSGLTDDERKFLQDMSGRYAEAFNQMKEVEACSETQHLHRSYGFFLAQQSNMYGDYIRIIGEPNACDVKTGRPLNGTMTDKRRYLYNLEKTNKVLDMRTRQTFHITKNPYEQRQREDSGNQ